MAIEVVDTYVTYHLSYTYTSMMTEADVQSVDGWHYVAVTLPIGIQAHYVVYIGLCVIGSSKLFVSWILCIIHLSRIRGSGIIIVELVKDSSRHSGSIDGGTSPRLVGPCSGEIPVLAQTLCDAYIEVMPAITYGKVLPAIVQYHSFTVEGTQ